MQKIVLVFAAMSVLSGCGGMVRAVRVVPDTADKLCRDTRPESRWHECQKNETPAKAG